MLGTESVAALSSVVVAVAVVDDNDKEVEVHVEVEEVEKVEEREMAGGRFRERTVCAGSKCRPLARMPSLEAVARPCISVTSLSA